MPLANNDLLIVERGGVRYKMTSQQIGDFLGAVRDVNTATITTRDAGTWTPQEDLKIGDRVFVADATGDVTVDSGWAIYRVTGTGPYTFNKIQEQESMDIAISSSTNLSYQPSPGQGEVVSDTGSNAIIPLADGTNAGLMSPTAFNAVHSPASSALTASTNPITVNGSQEINFNISQLQDLP